MIILHIGFLDGKFLLWGETSFAQHDHNSNVQNNKANPRDYPYGINLKILQDVFKEITLDAKSLKNNLREVAVWLPTKKDLPIPSSSLIAQAPNSRHKTCLFPWLINAFELPIDQLIPFLQLASGKKILYPRVAIGADVTFWANILNFSFSIIANQQYLPAISFIDAKPYAFWEPTFVGQNKVFLEAQAKLMPAISRALTPANTSSPPEQPSLYITRTFIKSFVDHIVRTNLSLESTPLQQKATNKKNLHFDNQHDAFIHSLQSNNPAMDNIEKEKVIALQNQLSEWRRPMTIFEQSPFRLCFRLEEPKAVDESKESPSDPWHVRYLIQPFSDPSLLVPVEDIWKKRGHAVSALTKHGSDFREFVLSSLGRASKICSNIEASLEETQPAHYQIDSTKAHQFLAEKASLLEQSGFGVMLPGWWTRKGTKSRLKMRGTVKSSSMQAKGGLSLEEIVKLDLEIILSDKKLSLQELEKLAKLKTPLVQIRGEWVEINADEITRAIDFWKKKSQQEISVRDLIKMSLIEQEMDGGLPLENVTADGWIQTLLEQLSQTSSFNKDHPIPNTFSGTLRPYQTRGYSWLMSLKQWGLGGCLADDMGLGKTIQSLALVLKSWKEDGDKRPNLLICPTSVVNNWKKEAEKFTPDLPILIHYGASRSKTDQQFQDETSKYALVISSYGLLQRDLRVFQNVPWNGVILDEAQNIKNPSTKQFQAARALKSDYRIALTGTPVENHVGDLWAIMDFLNPGFLGTQASFKRNFFTPIQFDRDPEASRKLKRATSPFILRRLKTDKSIIQDLPDKQEMKVFCTLTEEQASLYAAVIKDIENQLESAEGISRKGLVLALLSKLKQVCNHPAQFLGDNSKLAGRSGKLIRLTEMLEEILNAKERVLIFSQFAEMGKIVQTHLQESFGQEVLFLHGGLTKKKRDEMVERFQNDSNGPSIFVLSLKAGGTGLNLTKANHVFFIDRWWNPAIEKQAEDRAFRIGQTKNVQVHKFICAGTLEDKIDELIERKKEITDSIIGSGEGWLTELSTAAIKDLVNLRKEFLVK